LQNQTKSLIDYIDWLSEHVYADKNDNILRKSIDHGHALLLLDGLDEIPIFEQRKQVVDLVQNSSMNIFELLILLQHLIIR